MQLNKALINRGSITLWLDDEAIQAWYESATSASRGRPQRYSDLAITTVLVNKQPRRKQRGISEQKQLMIRMEFLILSTLIFHIFPYHIFVAMLTDSADKVAVSPKLTTP